VLTIRDVGLFVVRYFTFLETSARQLYSRLPGTWHDTPSSWLQARFRGKSRIRFIQVGAFDGITGDPLRSLVLEHPDWHGALIEPQPAAFARLRENYSGILSQLHLFNCAVSDSSAGLEMCEIEEREIERLGLPAWSREVASASEEHVKKHFPGVRTSKRAVLSMRISEVAEACGFEGVELIVMDVEGHERRILDDVDFDSLGVEVVVFEHKHMTEPEYRAVSDRLASLGFALRRYGRDTVAHR